MGGGASRSARTYLDFIVNGISLGNEVKNAGYDLVSVFAVEWGSSYRERAVQRLLLQADSDFPNGRRSLFVCGECGDLGCGAVTIILDISEETAIWHDFGYENTYEDAVRFKELQHLGPFRFSLESYRKTIESALTFISQTPDSVE
jgi:hypothetical protein